MIITAVLDLTVEEFDAAAQESYRTSIATTVGHGVTPADVVLEITAGSITVKATIHTEEPTAVASAMGSAMGSAMASAMASAEGETFMGFPVVGTVEVVVEDASPPPQEASTQATPQEAAPWLWCLVALPLVCLPVVCLRRRKQKEAKKEAKKEAESSTALPPPAPLPRPAHILGQPEVGEVVSRV